ncbi:hypothetical protein MRB53_023803 [Persea americana]|uniref:Uncharacterized protein n=1 Tax=Persea americana TaxID=3435 RepID=A0ACC2LAL0_PERAE|nr:hypothetical protein MRB53_023803 [Persea americana]
MGSTTSTHGKKKKQQQYRLPDVCRKLSLLLCQSSTATVLMEVLCRWRRRRSPEKETVAETRDSVQRSRRRRRGRVVSVD